LGIAKDWTLMQRKIVLYEKQIKTLQENIEQLREQNRFNYDFANTEEFVTTNLYLTEGIEKSHSDDQIDNLRKAYVNLLDTENGQLNLKSKYMEIASHMTPEHVSLLGQIIRIIDDLEKSEEPHSIRTKGVTLSGAMRELSSKNQSFTADQAAFLIRELEKNNLVVCDSGRGDQYRGTIYEGTFHIQGDYEFTKVDVLTELRKKGWIDKDGKIQDKLIMQADKFKESLDPKFNNIADDLLKFLNQLNQTYSEVRNSPMSQYLDMNIIAKPTGFGKSFYKMITDEPFEKENK
jgi:hypothetical protein